MTDRVPLYPGRVSLVPVPGQDNVFDLVMADGAVIAGTPLNKATFLKDQTAALFGLDASALPDDVFSAISSQKANIEMVSYDGNGTFGASNPSSVTFSFAPKIIIALSTAAGTQFFGKDAQYQVYVIACDALTETYRSGLGFNNQNSSGATYSAKKSSDGKTIYWYNSSAAYQLNVSGTTYNILAIG